MRAMKERENCKTKTRLETSEKEKTDEEAMKNGRIFAHTGD